MLAAVISAGFVAELTSIARPDLGFLLYAAGRVLEGARLYVDIVEINPPLIIGLNIPPVALARELGISPILTYRVLFAASLIAALFPAAILLRRIVPDSVSVRRAVLLALAFALFPLSGVDFGEREQLLLAFTLPYILLAAGRSSGPALGTWAAFGIGIMAGLGLALKPHFLVLWVGVELYLLWRTRRPTILFRPEAVAVAGLLAAYGVFVLVGVPEYLQLVSLVGSAYSQFLYEPFWRLLLSGPGALIPLLALLTYLALRRQAGHAELWDVLALAVLAFLLGGAAQQKGLRYHFYPSFALGTVLLALVALDAKHGTRSLIARLYRVVAASVVVTSVVITLTADLRQVVASRFGRRSDETFTRLTRFVRDHAAGESIQVFSYHIGSTFPLVNYTGTRSASRFPQLWILAASYLDEMHADGPLRYRTPAEMGPVERFLYEATYADLESHRPKLLLVLRNARDDKVNGLRRLDYMAYFGRDPRFRQILDQYQSLGVVGEFDVYERLPPGATRAGPAPRATSGVFDAVRVSEPGLERLARSEELILAILVFTVAFLWFGRRLVRQGSHASYPAGFDREDVV